MILKGRFNWKDPLHFLQMLTQEEKLIYETAEQFALQKLKPLIQKATKTEQMDVRSILKQMGSMGFIGSYLDNTISYTSYGLIQNRLDYVDSTFRTTLSVQSSLVTLPIYTFGSQEHKQKYLQPLQSGDIVGCFCLTEPNVGSNAGQIQTLAKYNNGKFLLNGCKTWITNSPAADIFLVWAKSQAHANKIKCFVLDKGTKGLSVREIKNKMSLRASPTGMVMFDDVEVSENQILPLSEGLSGPLTCLNSARYGIAWGVLGAAQDCYEKARNYVLERKQFGDKPLASHQLIQKDLADMATEISLGLLACYRLGKLKETQELSSEQISMLKRNSAKKALDIARKARDMLGANGIVDEYEIIRHVMNLESCITYEGTHNMQTLALGRAITSIPAFQ